jgi:arylsulfatase A
MKPSLIHVTLLMVLLDNLQAVERPNIVYIIADDHTYRDFGFMGSQDALTPNIDRLAAQSARFVNGYVPSSLCSPSLGVLLTGWYPHQSGLHYNHPPPGNAGFNKMQSRAEYEAARSPAFALIRSQPTLPRTLQQFGYASLQTGKFWEGHFSNAGFTEGMTLFEPAPHLNYPGANRTLRDGSRAAHGNGDNGLAIGRETMQPISAFLDRVTTQPFFLWYAPYLPHQPHDSPRAYYALHEARGVAEHRIPYLASISQFDDTVGQLLTMLEERVLLHNTLIVFVSDNGWTPGTERDKNRPQEFAPTRASKYSPFEDGLRTPILLRWDGHITPATYEQLVSSVDLLPTVLAAIGQPLAIPGLPGRSLLASAKGQEKLGPRRPVFGEIYPGDASSLGHPSRDIAYRWIRDGDYKLIVPHTQSGKAPWRNYVADTALFNVVRDPEEKQNLALTHPDRTKALRQELDAWWTPGDDSGVPTANPMTLR